jgi:hypothetical protein
LSLAKRKFGDTSLKIRSIKFHGNLHFWSEANTVTFAITRVSLTRIGYKAIDEK